jgi:hypothetical protein
MKRLLEPTSVVIAYRLALTTLPVRGRWGFGLLDLTSPERTQSPRMLSCVVP